MIPYAKSELFLVNEDFLICDGAVLFKTTAISILIIEPNLASLPSKVDPKISKIYVPSTELLSIWIAPPDAALLPRNMQLSTVRYPNKLTTLRYAKAPASPSAVFPSNSTFSR